MNLKYISNLALVAVAATLLLVGCGPKKEVSSAPKVATTQTAEMETTTTQAPRPSANAVYFAFDKSDLNASSRMVLDEYAAWLSSNDVNILIEGHCDERGSREYNLALGQRRADSVRGYLIGQGVSASRFDTVSYGEERPVCGGTGEACWAQNRRAEILSR